VHVSVLEQSIFTLRFSTLGGRTHVLPLTALTAMQFAWACSWAQATVSQDSASVYGQGEAFSCVQLVAAAMDTVDAIVR
jgi:hypothetical protein